MRLPLFSKIILRGTALYLLYKWWPKPLQASNNNNTLLWKIAHANAVAPSYVFGTMHLMCAEDAVLSAAVKRVIQKVKAVYLEVALDSQGGLNGHQLQLTMGDGHELSTLLPAADYHLVKSYFANHHPGVPFTLLEKQFPLLLTSSLYELFLPCEIKNGVELKIVEAAGRYRKPVLGLESIAYQMEIFNSIPYQAQAADLAKTINNIGQFKQSMDEMVAMYKRQNIIMLEELTRQEETGVGGHLDVLLYRRNYNWAAQITSLAQQKSTLFAVGAGHLAGKEGLLQLLRKNGFVVTPLNNQKS